MADQDLHTRFLPVTWRRDLDLFLAEHAAGMNGYMISRKRLASLVEMYSLSDSELAAMGLMHKDIPAFVFEDILPG
ncbi:hypothetical protein SAMN04487859_11334 [Roseovarius lutimaris]|uniref:Uncharacterized protein n=1 Tax=Roseovarius lutimaris TaxID=1005928 RepID=A0A1I5DPH5_9RHOB|nr:hypothetical protein [Roseovarius lutimaris]SFO01057.1 hypothetical protein SAMN04487859_11334 [Roseovarius lutimaris]